MNNNENKKYLLTAFETIDKMISKPIYAVSISLLGISLGLMFLHIIFDLPTTYVGLLLMVLSLGLNISGRYSSKKSKKVVLEIFGFKCKNCSKTPDPTFIYSGSQLAYCPHCQLKYSVDDAQTAIIPASS